MEINLNPGQAFEMAEGFKEELDKYISTTDRLAKSAKKRGSDFDYYDDPEYEIFQDFLKDLNKEMQKYIDDHQVDESILEEDFDEVSKLRHRLAEINKAIEQGDDPERWSKLKERIFDRLDELKADYYDSTNESVEIPSEFLSKDAIDYLNNPLVSARWSSAYTKEVEDYIKEVGKENILNKDISINEENSKAVDNNEAMVEELQNTLKQVSDMQEKVLKLQEKLSVSYAKERKLTEDIEKQKSAISKLTVSNKRAEALKVKVDELEKNNSSLNEQLNSNKEALKKANEKLEQSKANSISLRESIIKRDSDRKELAEKVQSLEKDNQSLNEALDSLKKDYNLKKSKYSQLLEDSNKLIEKYKIIAEKSINKYIDSKAIALGVKSEEIKNKLPQNYSFRDIDLICEDLKKYKVSINKLPFNTMLNENTKIKAVPSKNDKLVIATGFDDDIDDQLLELAKYNK